MHDTPSVMQDFPHYLHYYVVVPFAAVQLVYNEQLPLLDIGNHPHIPSVPNIQLAYNRVFEQDVIAMQFVPLVVQCGDAF